MNPGIDRDPFALLGSLICFTDFVTDCNVPSEQKNLDSVLVNVVNLARNAISSIFSW